MSNPFHTGGDLSGVEAAWPTATERNTVSIHERHSAAAGLPDAAKSDDVKDDAPR